MNHFEPSRISKFDKAVLDPQTATYIAPFEAVIKANYISLQIL
jgi:hypothetical protein